MAEILQQPATDKPPPHFTDDVLIEIFQKLPARSLFLFRSVCKHWLHLIESPYFIHLHLNRPNNNPMNNPILVVHTSDTKLHPNSESNNCTISLLSDDETTPYDYDLPLLSLGGSLVLEVERSHLLFGPCNGIFCISDGSCTNDILVFNPTTKVCRYVPPYFKPNDMPRCCGYTHDIHHSIGFGFDPVSDDYKVVRLRELGSSRNEYNDDTSYHRYYNFKIFSLSTNQWSEVNHVLQGDQEFSRIDSDFLFCNGAFHWFDGVDGYASVSSRWINVFDLNKESLRQFEPPDIEDDYDIYVSLSVVDESLAIIKTDCCPNLCEGKNLQIWVMKEYGVYKSWSKLYSIHVDIEMQLSFGMGGEFLFSNFNSKLVSVNLNTGVIKELGVNGATLFAFRFKESLVSLKNVKSK